MNKTPVGILGATGVVGQRFVQLLDDHPWFEVSCLAASNRSAGQRYGESCDWHLPGRMPARAADMTVNPIQDLGDAPLYFSALPTEIAGQIESRLASRGAIVCSNAAAHRLDPDVPLIIPEVNLDHFELLTVQKARRGWEGALICSPNCSATQLTLALKPIQERFGIEAIMVTTLQALSGAGYPGVASMDIAGNVIPYIAGEEEKIQKEVIKLLGEQAGGEVTPADCSVSATCTRVAVREGHLMSVSLKMRENASLETLEASMAEFRPGELVSGLPSTPEIPIHVSVQRNRPQPVLDLLAGQGMAVSIGRLRACPVLDVQFIVLGHNTIRGAAGGAIHNAECVHALGWLDGC